MARHFTVVESSGANVSGSKFAGEDPAAAAKKAALKVLGPRRKEATFVLRETTDASKKGRLSRWVATRANGEIGAKRNYKNSAKDIHLAGEVMHHHIGHHHPVGNHASSSVSFFGGGDAPFDSLEDNFGY
jgi:hypothetical protein